MSCPEREKANHRAGRWVLQDRAMGLQQDLTGPTADLWLHVSQDLSASTEGTEEGAT